SKGASFYRINRGGDITYHGPGQIVGYPIINLDRFEIGVREYIFRLEEAVILTLAKFDISASRLEGATGVWLDPEVKGKSRKICAIGVRASRGVTMHGFAFNVNTDLRFYDYINPCGFTDRGVTSMEKELGTAQDIEKVKASLKIVLAQVFGCVI
ncbi:MAG: lipoyl(octanoyl) transferase LipB, partial [Bacteroidales bacterium]|nr:lipoyl(octanoyl) transferase LipB [Bacteroidales bacterium]